jgi:hypothetical protein
MVFGGFYGNSVVIHVVSKQILLSQGLEQSDRSQSAVLYCIINCIELGQTYLCFAVWNKHSSLLFLQHEDAGEYRCIATNDAGSSEATAYLTVRSQWFKLNCVIYVI